MGVSAEAVSEVVKTSGPPVKLHGSRETVRNPRCESGARSREHDEVRVHAVRLGGRNRFDASCVFSAVVSQDTVTDRGR